MRYPSKAGFTLLELIIVMLLAALAASVAAVAVGRSHDRTVLRQEAAKVRNLLGHARERSLMERAPFALVINGETGAYRLERAGSPVGRPFRPGEGVRLEGGPIGFFPKGNSTGGRLTLKGRQNRGYYIEVDEVTGKARVGRL